MKNITGDLYVHSNSIAIDENDNDDGNDDSGYKNNLERGDDSAAIELDQQRSILALDDIVDSSDYTDDERDGADDKSISGEETWNHVSQRNLSTKSVPIIPPKTFTHEGKNDENDIIIID